MDQEPSLFDVSYHSDWMDFRLARDFARQLGLSGQDEWLAYCKGERPAISLRPDHIPSDPEKVYQRLGWVSWKDWLGIAEVVQMEEGKSLWNAGGQNKFLPFSEARAFVHSLGLEYEEDWNDYVAGKLGLNPPLPEDIPADPESVYRFFKWGGWRDWLLAPESEKDYRNYRRAKEFVWCLGIASEDEWRRRGEELEKLMESYGFKVRLRPDLEYKDKDWKGWEEWLGY